MSEKYKSIKFLPCNYLCLPDWIIIRKVEETKKNCGETYIRHTWDIFDILNTSPCPPINLNDGTRVVRLIRQRWAGSFCPWPVTKSGPPTFWLCCMPWEAWAPPSHPKKINLLEDNLENRKYLRPKSYLVKKFTQLCMSEVYSLPGWFLGWCSHL